MSKIFLAATLTAACVVLFAAFTIESHNRTDRRDWRQRVSEDGGIRSYATFKAELNAQDFTQSERHARMHVFGAALYDVEGIDGIGVCDAAYDFGCYHGFFSRAVSEKGESVVPKLAEACRAKFNKNSTGCEHGIGHGIMEYVGAAKLLEGLSLCEGTHQVNPLYGCTSGLFMEYNMPMTYASGTVRTEIRPFNVLDPRAPCDSVVPSRFRASCYFEMSAWWGHVFTDDGKAGNLCSKGATDEERFACWKGWGTVVAEKVQYDAGRVAPICGLIHDVRGRDHCMLGVAQRLYVLPGHEKEVAHICESLASDVAEECSKLFSNE